MENAYSVVEEFGNYFLKGGDSGKYSVYSNIVESRDQ